MCCAQRDKTLDQCAGLIIRFPQPFSDQFNQNGMEMGKLVCFWIAIGRGLIDTASADSPRRGSGVGAQLARQGS
jgi:hypothetical protein